MELKKYDFFIFSLNCVIEMHGNHHYEQTNRKGARTRTLKEEQENDNIKKELAIKNGIEYIPIRADLSELEYIKNNILNSNLAQKIDLKLIDWDKCDNDSQKSLVRIACEYFNNGLSTLDIALLMKLHRTTVTRYLKRGTRLKWCNYDPLHEWRQNGKKNGKLSSKAVFQLSLDGECLREFQSIKDAGNSLGIKSDYISQVCKNNKRKTAGGFKWIYKEDYEKLNKSS